MPGFSKNLKITYKDFRIPNCRLITDICMMNFLLCHWAKCRSSLLLSTPWTVKSVSRSILAPCTAKQRNGLKKSQRTYFTHWHVFWLFNIQGVSKGGAGGGGNSPPHFLARACFKFLRLVSLQMNLLVTVMIMLVKNCLVSLSSNKILRTTFGGYFECSQLKVYKRGL